MENYWTMDEVVAYLQRSRQRVMEYIKTKGLPFTRIGEKGNYYFDEVKVREWFAKQGEQMIEKCPVIVKEK